MNKRIKNFKLAATLIAVSIFTSSESIHCFVSAADTKEISYRTNCFNLYGDLNEDGCVDTFDLITMREIAVENEYSLLADLNRDEKVDKNDLTMLNDYVLGKNVIFDSYFYVDADEDSVCDLFEVLWLKTNPDSADTDGDTISDYNEIVYSRTSPTDKYTRGLSVTDSEDDYDEDNLTNAEEIAAGTDPQLSDSDMDDISDYDEIKKYNTNPNDDDSDDDNINDNDELKLGLKPDSNKSDGEKLDNERTFEQTISSDNVLLSDINTDESPYTISVEIDSAGIAEKEFIISKSRYSQYINDNILGNAIDVSYNENLSLANLKLIFNLNEELYKNNNIEDYMVFEFLPEKNYLLPVETKYDENKVYIETERESTYCLVKKQDVFSANNDITVDSDIVNTNIFSKNKSASSEPLNTENQEIQIVFLMDESVFWNDEIEKNFYDLCFEINEKFSNAKFCFLGCTTVGASPSDSFYNISASGILPKFDSDGIMKPYISNFRYMVNQTESNTIGPFGADTDSMINLLNTRNYHDLDLNNDFYTDECAHKYAFIMDPIVKFDFNRKSSIDEKIKRTQDDLKKIAESGIKLNLLLTPPEYEYGYTIQRYNQLKTDCQKYNFGIYSFSENENYVSDISSIIYSDLIFKDSNNVDYNLSVNPDSIPEKVNKNALINSMYGIDESKIPEADENGDIDFEEAINKLGIKFETLSSACSENEQNEKGLEQLFSNFSVSAEIIGQNVQILPFSDSLLRKDSDGDTIPDADDPFPDEAFDSRFEIVNDYNYEPSVDFVERHYKNSLKCYGSMLNVTDRDAKSLAIATLLFEDSDIFADGISCFVDQAEYDFGLYPERKEDSSALNRAFKAMRHYLFGSGKKVYYSESDTSELISSSVQNIIHLFDNISRTMRCSEEILNNGDTVIISLKSNQKLKGVCLIKDKAENDTKDPNDIVNCDIIIGKETGLKEDVPYYCNYVHRDWNLTVGEAIGTIVAKVERNDNKFTMHYKYYIKDIYEWAYHYEIEKTLTSHLHLLHDLGAAKEYLMQGCIEGSLTWNLNDRIVDNDIFQQLFMTLAEKQGGTESETWKKSNEVDRIKSIFSLELEEK